MPRSVPTRFALSLGLAALLLTGCTGHFAIGPRVFHLPATQPTGDGAWGGGVVIGGGLGWAFDSDQHALDISAEMGLASCCAGRDTSALTVTGTVGVEYFFLSRDWTHVGVRAGAYVGALELADATEDVVPEDAGPTVLVGFRAGPVFPIVARRRSGGGGKWSFPSPDRTAMSVSLLGGMYYGFGRFDGPMATVDLLFEVQSLDD
ncbi:MAG: hypothetical protein ACI9WU_003633 [Myxococcota bacterium]|jgi:hypothetical protein